MKKQPNSRNCFVCGIENPVGLNLAFWQEGERVFTRVRFPTPYQSYPGVAHGGLVTAILDETIGRAIIGLGDRFAFTARLEMRFRAPAPLETPLVAAGWIDRERRGWIYASGQMVVEATGEVVATASGTFAPLPPSEETRMRQELDFWQVTEDYPTHAPPDRTTLRDAGEES